jgi:ABC-type Mn2+/Zn2+ transport system ATPase subunit
MLVEATDVTFGHGRRPVVRANHLTLRAGRCLGVFGPNGSGKTTLVRGLLGLLQPMSGRVVRKPVRAGYLPQHRAIEAHWPMSAADAASMAVSSRKHLGWVGREAGKVREAMRTMAVDHLARRQFAKLSGGEQQRVLLAGALASAPDVLVLDEPTDGLDLRSRRELLDALVPLAAGGLATLIVSHDLEDLAYLCDEVAMLHPGEEAGRPSDVELVAINRFSERLAAAGRHP